MAAAVGFGENGIATSFEVRQPFLRNSSFVGIQVGNGRRRCSTSAESPERYPRMCKIGAVSLVCNPVVGTTNATRPRLTSILTSARDFMCIFEGTKIKKGFIMSPSQIGFALLASACSIPISAGLAVSNFDTDSDGWTAVDVPTYGPYDSLGAPVAVTYHGGGGNPGGHISASDPSVQTFLFEAPAKFTGDKSAFYGQALTFDLLVDLAGAGTWEEGVEVVLVGGGLTVVRDIGINPLGVWQTLSFNLNETGWSKEGGGAVSVSEFQLVLGGLTRLRIVGEYASGVVETTALDNVALVPEPRQTTVWTSLFLGGLVLARRYVSARLATLEPWK